MKAFYILYIIFIASGCMQKTDKEHEAKLLLETDKDFASTSLKKGAAEAFRLYLAKNAIQMPQGAEPIYGNENIYKIMKSNDSNYTLEWEPQFAEVSDLADMGWTWVTYTVKSNNDSLPKSYGKYVNVWKKQDDGSWKVSVDIGNSNPQPLK